MFGIIIIIIHKNIDMHLLLFSYSFWYFIFAINKFKINKCL